MNARQLLDHDTSDAINRRNAEILAQVDRDVKAAATALLCYLLALLAFAALLHFGAWCADAYLCMGVLGFVNRSGTPPQPEAEVLSSLQTKVTDAVAAARAAGELDGERLGYIQGTRYGVCVGAVYGFLLGAGTIIACLLAGLHKGYGL